MSHTSSKEARKCIICWWNDGGRKLSQDIIGLRKGDVMGALCWAWRPQENQDRLDYLEVHGREVDRIGILPTL